MPNELDVLKLVSERLNAAQLRYMLTGSFALAYYATPRMTRDLDLVVELNESDIARITEAFADGFYVDPDDARTAVVSQRMFNLMHWNTGIKVDFIVRKKTKYREIEFERRKPVRFDGVETWIVSCEDLILSKLLWSLESNSELQRRDVAALARTPIDRQYLKQWADSLGISALLEQILA